MVKAFDIINVGRGSRTARCAGVTLRVSVALKAHNHFVGRWLRLLDKYGSYGGNDRVVVQPAGLKFLTRLLSDSGGEGVRQLLSWSLVRQWLPLSDGSLDTEGPLARNVSCVETVLSVLRLPFLAHVLFESE
ncbi:hypothetical protein MRX96_009853 [Rhipicephalus microplus]